VTESADEPHGHAVHTELPAHPDVAWALLEDPRSFRYLVPGARRIRRFHPRWPEPGTEVQLTVGLPPLLVRDCTEVLAAEPPERLLLDAHLRHLGSLHVEFRFRPVGGGTRLTIRESVSAGPLAAPGLRQATELAIAFRNLDICRRYRRLVKRRRSDRARPSAHATAGQRA
jgi:carbon monoxide dehydrogenase subunit G